MYKRLFVKLLLRKLIYNGSKMLKDEGRGSEDVIATCVPFHEWDGNEQDKHHHYHRLQPTDAG